ncbi:hypothetical protein B9Z55_017903 [Caenorhabditis nigoni]|nr:hypothetical protein B9Z55_017903 [Caenorhabditis nigoni]
MTIRCSLVAASYAILLIHFIYRYLVIHNSSLTSNKFHWYMLFSIFVCALYFGVWYAICYFPGEANTEIREYIREEFRETFGNDSMDFNMLAALYSEGSDETKLRSWLAVLLWTSVSTISIIMFVAMAITASCTKKKYSLHRTFTDSDAIEEDDEEHKQKDIKAPIRPASSSCCPNGHPHCYQLLSLYSLLV